MYKKQIKQYILKSLFLWLFLPLNLWGQVMNDICEEATKIAFSTSAPKVCISGTNTEAQGELPYIGVGNCQGEQEMPQSAADVWFQFTAEKEWLDMSLEGSLTTTVVALYEGDCSTLIGRDCWIEQGVNLAISAISLTIGQNYWLQISGAGLNDQGNFDFCLENYAAENLSCIGNQRLAIDVPPSRGTYAPNQTVRFCLAIDNYFLGGFDWLHGIVPQFGSAWDVSTIVPEAVKSCDGAGNWAWYESVISTNEKNAEATGVQGPGFFYDSIESSETDVVLDANPGNNYGDNPNGGNCNWEFCFTISTKNSCPPGIEGEDLSIQFLNFADSETGITTSSSDCAADADFSFKAVLTCCQSPDIRISHAQCGTGDKGRITAQGNGVSPFFFEWSTGLAEAQPDSSYVDGLEVGFYTVTVTDINSCKTVHSASIIEENDLQLNLDNFTAASCGLDNGRLEIDITGGQAPFTYILESYPPQNSPLFTALAAGTYGITVTDGQDCGISDSFTLNGTASFTPELTINQPDCPAGRLFGNVSVVVSGGQAPYLYALNEGVFQSEPLFDDLREGEYTYTIQDATGCLVELPFTIDALPDYSVSLGADQSLLLGDSVLLEAVVNQDNIRAVTWTPTTALDCPTCLITTARPETTTTYTVKVEFDDACVTTSQITLTVTTIDPVLHFPTAFSPNNDQYNDIFRPIIQNVQQIESYELSIYNRWGQLIFKTDNIEDGWDGRLNNEILPVGVYIYSLSFQNRQLEQLNSKGTVSLIR